MPNPNRSVRRFPTLFLPLFVLAPLGCSDSPTEAADDSPFLGTWLLTHHQGVPVATAITWTFTSDEITLVGPSTLTATYSFDVTTNPRRLDISLAGALPNPNLAIYAFPSSTTLLVKLMDGASTRASNFSVESGYEVQQFSKQ